MTADRMTQAQRRARTRDALLEATARGLSRHGYANLALEQVAREAGYTRGALYHQFAGKDDLILAAVEWIEETWWQEMSRVLTPGAEPVAALGAVARAHAVLCRRDIARVRMVLTVEFSGRDHPIGKAVAAASERVLDVATDLIEQGRRSGTIPSGPPAHVVALGLLGAVEGLVSHLAGHVDHDELLAERAVLGVLGVLGVPSPTAAS
jgi:AcrR family transcriptional regulator